MMIIYQRTGSAFCRPTTAGGSGDSAAATARGVLATLPAGTEHVSGTRSLTGRRIGILGLGSVGRKLAHLLHQRGAELTVSDINDQRRADARGARSAVARTERAPDRGTGHSRAAAVGGVLTREVAERLRCRLIVGRRTTNSPPTRWPTCSTAAASCGYQTSSPAQGELSTPSASRGARPDRKQVTAQIDAIGDTVARVLTEAAQSSLSPLVIARHLASLGPAAVADQPDCLNAVAGA
jgi:leucine dehydrogenase